MSGLVKLLDVTVENFLSFRNTHHYNLVDQGLVFVHGVNRDDPSTNSNGAGKSTLFLDAPTWALFGKTARDIDADQVVNDQTGKGTVVTVRLEVPSLGVISVQRFRKLKGKNGVRVWRGGVADSEDAKREELRAVELTALDASKTTELIADWLGLDLEVWYAAVYRAQGHEARFCALRDSEQKALLTRVFELSVIDVWQEEAKRAAALCASELTNLRAQIDALTEEERRIDLPKLRALAAEQGQHREAQLVRLRQEVERLRGEWGQARQTEKRLERVHAEILALRASPPPDPTDLESLPAPVEYLDPKPPAPPPRQALNASPIEGQRTELLQTIARVQENQRMKYAELEMLRRSIAEVRAKRSGICPECGAPLSPEHAEREALRRGEQAKNIEASLARWVQELENRQLELQTIEAAIELRNAEHRAEEQRRHLEYQSAMEVFEQSRLSLAAARKQAQVEWQSAYNQIAARNAAKLAAVRAPYERHLADLEAEKKILEKRRGEAQRLEQQGRALKAELAFLEAAPDLPEKALRDAEIRAAEVQMLMGEKRRAVNQFSEHAQYLEFWQTGFGARGLKAFVLDEKIQALTTRANRWLGKLSGATTWLRFETQTQTKSGALSDAFSVRVFRSDGGRVVERAYGALSGGQQARVALAIDLALADAVAARAEHRYDLLVLDEAFRHLDRAGRDLVVDVLQELRRERSSIFVADHDPMMASGFERQVTVTHENGESRIEA